MSRARASGVATLAVGLAALLLAGCQGNPEPPPLDGTPTPSPSPSSSPTPTAPTLPPEAKGTSTAAAKAFVRHWIHVLNYAGPAGDPEAVRRLSSRECAACVAISQFIEEVDAQQGSISGDGWHPVRFSVVSADGPSGQVVIDALVEVRPQEIQTSRDDEPESFPGGQRLKTFWLKPRGPSWVVIRLDQPS